ncbi:hypothetical protein HN51_066628 [Arachis hypogaea]
MSKIRMLNIEQTSYTTQNFKKELEKRQNICVRSLSCVTVHALYFLKLLSQYRPRQISDDNLEEKLDILS